MSKHTIGPWEAQAGNTSGQEVIAPGAPKTRRNVARCGGADRDANARLIAAAPDLLAALKAVVQVADRATVEFDAARAAIAKAEA